MNKISGYQPSSFCASCSACCENMGCEYSPGDFKIITFESLRKHIERGFTSIDWWEGDPRKNKCEFDRTYFLRARNKNADIVDSSWGGICSLLSETGCTLSFNDRPKGGRFLKPKKLDNESCYCEYTKLLCCLDWIPYQEILQQLFEYF